MAFPAYTHAATIYQCQAATPAKGYRFASFNVFLNRPTQGKLLEDLRDASDQLGEGQADTQIRAVAEIIQRVRPDILLLNEFDYDAKTVALTLFQQNYLNQAQNHQAPIHYPYVVSLPSNTGISIDMDLDGNGEVGGPSDALGYGRFPGQYAMALLSRYPIVEDQVRSFQQFLWRDMPGALLPDNGGTKKPADYLSDAVLDKFRLSSKSHWDVPVAIGGHKVHVLAAHPTPPVFDGKEDRNGRRNHDEIRFWADYVSNAKASHYIYDDNGVYGGLGQAPFVIMGDYNADPHDGDSTNNAIDALLSHSAINAQHVPASQGGAEDTATEGGANLQHNGDPAVDTSDFKGSGNLRIDYVLPSKRGLTPTCGGVFWPSTKDAARYLVGDGDPVVSSDHRLVWLDLALTN